MVNNEAQQEVGMPYSDKFVGAVILAVFGVMFLLYLFLRLIVIPLLPTDDSIFRFLEPATILTLCETFGFMFLGGLTVYTYYNYVDPIASEE